MKMNKIFSNRQLILQYLAIVQIAFSLAFTATISLAQEDNSSGSFKERLKQRLLEKQLAKPAPAASTDTTTPIDQPGDYNFSFVHDGLTRMYRIHVPQNYSNAKPTPLLMAFHGGGGDMMHQASDKNYGLISKAEAAGFIAVFPNGYSKFNSGVFATWNAGNCCGDARDRKVDDVGFIRKVIDNLGRQLNIDHHRIYATGMSNGGMMTYRLACEMADTFKAIAAVAGTDNTTSCAPKTPIPILHIHAQDDDHVLFNGGAGKTFKDMSKVTEFTSVPATISKWVKLNGCNATPQRVLEKPGAYCDKYSPCRSNAEVQLCVTATGAHSWPGGVKIIGGEAGSTAISADDVMWDFFTSTQSKP